jgi:hypothetical protein
LAQYFEARLDLLREKPQVIERSPAAFFGVRRPVAAFLHCHRFHQVLAGSKLPAKKSGDKSPHSKDGPMFAQMSASPMFKASF